MAPAAGRGKAFFVERLLKQVVIGESGLAGVNRRLEMEKAAWQLGAYAAIALIVAVGLIAWSMSYASNRTYLAQVAADVATLRRVPTPAAGASLEALLPRFNAVRAVADSAEPIPGPTPPGAMRWGALIRANVGRQCRARCLPLREPGRHLVLPRFAARVEASVWSDLRVGAGEALLQYA